MDNSEISFFKHNPHFLGKKSPDMLKAASRFYKWQLLSRNREYRRRVDNIRLSPDPVLEHNIEAARDWGISEVIDYKLINPPMGFKFIHEKSVNYSLVAKPSIQQMRDEQDRLEEGEEYPVAGIGESTYWQSVHGKILDEMGFLTGGVPDEELAEPRFLVFAIDMKTGFSQEAQAGFIKEISSQVKEYKAKYHFVSGKSLVTPTSLRDFEKNIITFDILTKNKGDYTGLKKVINNTLGGNRTFDITTYRKKLGTVSIHIENVRKILTNITSL